MIQRQRIQSSNLTQLSNHTQSPSNSTHQQPILKPFIIGEQNKYLTSYRSKQCQIHAAHAHQNCLCHFVNLKGLQKSGTSWQIASLKEIQHYFCDIKFSPEYARRTPLCVKWHVGSYNRHPMELPNKIMTNPRFSKRLKNNTELFNKIYNRSRFCTVTVFRDQRDRKVSWTHWNIKSRNITDPELLFKVVNQGTMAGYKPYIDQYNTYWNLMRNAELNEPMRFYNYFYEDMVLNTTQQIKDTLEFIGFYSLEVDGIYITDEDIEAILKRVSGDSLIATGANILLRKGKICGFYDELTPENAKSCNEQIAKYLLPELIQKYNKTCTVPNL